MLGLFGLLSIGWDQGCSALWCSPGTSLIVFSCPFFQAETLLTGLVTPLLKEKYGADEAFTQIWNVTMTEVC